MNISRITKTFRNVARCFQLMRIRKGGAATYFKKIYTKSKGAKMQNKKTFTKKYTNNIHLIYFQSVSR